MKRILYFGALLLPLLGLAGATLSAWLGTRDGRVWELPVRGYDPRDLLRGHYIVFQYDLADGASCVSEKPCCLQVVGTAEVARASLQSCTSNWNGAQAQMLRDHAGLRISGGQAFGQLYVDEQYAAQLDARLRQSEPNARVRFHISPTGKLTPRLLLLDGQPYHEALQRR